MFHRNASVAGALWAGRTSRAIRSLESRKAGAAIEAENWVKAEARYLKLLEMSAAVHPSLPRRCMPKLCRRWPQIYKRIDNTDKLENLFQQRVENSPEGMDRGLSQADLGFFYQSSDFASADQFHGERLSRRR